MVIRMVIDKSLLLRRRRSDSAGDNKDYLHLYFEMPDTEEVELAGCSVVPKAKTPEEFRDHNRPASALASLRCTRKGKLRLKNEMKM